MEGVLDEIRDSGEKVLFIMDVVVNDMKKEARLEKLLCKVLMNRRHQCGSGGSLSVWITTTRSYRARLSSLAIAPSAVSS